MQRLLSLDPRHKAAARMKIQGLSNTVIAETLNITMRTLVLWYSDDLVKEYLQQLAENVEQEFAIQLAQAGMQSVTELTRMLAMPDRDEALSANTKLQIAQDLMDRLPATARVRERGQQAMPSSGGNTNNTIIANMSDSELAAMLNGGWRAMLNPGTNGHGSNGAGD